MARWAAVILVGITCATAPVRPVRASGGAPGPVETLQAVAALPPHLSGRLEDAIGFAQASTGEYIVLDRRVHTIYAVDAGRTSIRKVIEIGLEQGRVLQPGVLALSKDDILAVADAPNGLERIQYFNLAGLFLGGFYLQTRVAPRLVVGPLVLNGVGSMHFTGRTFLVNRPETGALFSEIDIQGRVLRHVGVPRRTGHESDPDLHSAMNIGMPLADPSGGFLFVFQTGVPLMRKYDAAGTLVYERHIEGPELDAAIQNLPTEWPRRAEGAGLPIVEPLVRTAAVDSAGRLWVSLMAPFTYVYDAAGEKTRTVQFRAAGIISPRSLTFARGNRVLVTPGCYEFRTEK
jgi:hypothetical protein